MEKNNSFLINSRKKKNDEFYTHYQTIEDELKHYTEHFKNKIIYCNCDSEKSNFVNFFKDNFNKFQLKDLIYTSDDFRTHEDLLKQADIVITNPPFSLLKEFILFLNTHNKKFVILGTMNILILYEIFELLINKKIWTGIAFNKKFIFDVPEKYNINKKLSVSGLTWITNLKILKQIKKIDLQCKYDPKIYPKYDNYDAINVNKVIEIPYDYEGVMGVPLTFLKYWNPEQFKIVGEMTTTKITKFNFGLPTINNKRKYARILIKKIANF